MTNRMSWIETGKVLAILVLEKAVAMVGVWKIATNLISADVFPIRDDRNECEVRDRFLQCLYRNKTRSELLDHGSYLAIYTDQGCSEGLNSRVTFLQIVGETICAVKGFTAG